MFSNRLLKRIIPRNASKRRSFWMSSNTGRQILEKLNSLTLKQDALTEKQTEMSNKQTDISNKQTDMSNKQTDMSNKQTDMSNKLGEVSKDIYNIKIVIAAVGMATGLMLAASRVLKISSRDKNESMFEKPVS